MTTKNSLAQAFRLAIPLIRDGEEHFICFALAKLYNRGEISGDTYKKTIRIIRNRLGRWSTVEFWLYDNIQNKPCMSSKIYREYRVRWLEHLEKEFSEKGE